MPIDPSSLFSKINSGQKRLSMPEEKRLIKLVQSGDETAASTLVLSQLRFVLFVAKKYRRFGHPVAELLQEGIVGLLEAIKRFNPDKNVRLSTYAMWWVRAAMQDYVVRSRSLVKIGTSSAQKSIFFHLYQRYDQNSENHCANEALMETLSRRFNVTFNEVICLARRIAWPDQSLDSEINKTPNYIFNLTSEELNPEEKLISSAETKLWKKRLSEALTLLPPRELAIIKSRFLSEKIPSRKALGQKLGVSKERIRQLELRALARMRGLLRPHAA
ncbi:MAG: sigma-70 family RNA polymerase sigma factor [Pseudomonadota bacterium]|nr:sigma-70 family RNA polymerase sigma factor [Pseudomonadota bacterium]